MVPAEAGESPAGRSPLFKKACIICRIRYNNEAVLLEIWSDIPLSLLQFLRWHCSPTKIWAAAYSLRNIVVDHITRNFQSKYLDRQIMFLFF